MNILEDTLDHLIPFYVLRFHYTRSEFCDHKHIMYFLRFKTIFSKPRLHGIYKAMIHLVIGQVRVV